MPFGTMKNFYFHVERKAMFKENYSYNFKIKPGLKNVVRSIKTMLKRLCKRDLKNFNVDIDKWKKLTYTK